MELINGDTEVASEKTPFSNNKSKQNFDDMLRLKILNDAKSQKEKLEQKLGYLNNSINALSRF